MHALKNFPSRSLLNRLTWLLLLARCLTLQADANWLPGLFSSFVFQYMVAGIALGLLLVWRRGFAMAVLAIAVALISLNQMWFATIHVPAQPSVKPALTIAQYNRLYTNLDHRAVKQWLIDNRAAFDVVAFHEANHSLAAMLDEVRDIYPYAVLRPDENAGGMIVLSRTPFLSNDLVKMQGPGFFNVVIHVVVQPPGMIRPVSIYALHAQSPFGALNTAHQDYEMTSLAAIARRDRTPHVVVEGDFNSTPYAPAYRRLASISGLTEQRTALLPLPTWPSFLVSWLMQIPIDHILTDKGLRLVRQNTGPGMGSDHLPVIDAFIENATP